MNQFEQKVYKYLATNCGLIDNNQQNLTKIFTHIEQKDKTIQNLQADLTKLRCDNMRLNKSIKQLQQKLSLTSANNNNTGSSFMMASQFKNCFDNFMKQTVSNTFSNLIVKPGLYARVFQSLLKLMYQTIQNQINKIVLDIAKIIKLEDDSKTKIFVSLLKILQDNNQSIFQINKQFLINQISDEGKQQVIELVNSDDFQDLLKQLQRLIIFMQLQQNRWQFSMPLNKVLQYNKKDYTCIDGWVKEKQKVLILFEGLVKQKDNFQHPNIKNYVIPVGDGQDNVQADRLSGSLCLYKQKKKQIKEIKQEILFKPQIKQIYQQKVLIVQNKKIEQTNVRQKQLIIKMQETIQLEKTKTSQLKIQQLSQLQTHQNINIMIPKLEIQQSNDSINYNTNIQKQIHRFQHQHYSSNNLQDAAKSNSQRRLKAFVNQQAIKKKKNDSLMQCRKKKTGKISDLLTDPDFSEILVFPKQRKQKIMTLQDQLFESRIINKNNLKNKKVVNMEDSKRNMDAPKKSVGKIINQSNKVHVSTQNKESQSQNKQNHNNTNSLKEAVYKQIIKNKFKEQRTLLKLRQPDKKLMFYDNFVSKTERIAKDTTSDMMERRKKNENRPLKPSQEHIHRVIQRNNLL